MDTEWDFVSAFRSKAVSWEQLPGRELPAAPIPDLAPDLAVEVLSEGNTPEEMRRRLKDYFFAGVRLVWLVDPEARTVTVYTAPDRSACLKESQTLDAGDVLPGFRLPLAELFARFGRPRGTRQRGRKGKRSGKR